MMQYGKETVTLFEVDQPFCKLRYGTTNAFGTCPAVLGVDSNNKCFNTRKTCPVPDSYDPDILTLRFSYPQEGIEQYGPVIPSIIDIETTAATINLAAMDRDLSPMGSREVVDVELEDHKSGDHQVDPYRLERPVAIGSPTINDVYDPYEQGTFWGKWLARNPYFSNYRCRKYEGFVGDAIADMRVHQYILDKVNGPTEGRMKLVALDLFTLIDRQKAVAPLASVGELSAGITDVASSLTLLPAGIGDLEYQGVGSPEVLIVAIGDELIDCTRVGDVLTLTTRGAYGTTAEAHDAEDLVQLVLEYSAQLAVDITYDLLLNYTELTTAELPKAEWDIAAAALASLYTTRIAVPTPVIELVGELKEQAGFTLWADTANAQIQLSPLRPKAPKATVTDEGWIIADSIDIEIETDKRASQVWVYYGQVNPTLDLEERKNYHSRSVTPDLAAQLPEQYGAPAIRTIFSRWIPQFGRQEAEAIGDRVLSLFRNPPIEVTFKLDAQKHEALGLAELFVLQTADIQDDTGAVRSLTMATVEAEHAEFEITIKAQQVEFTIAEGDTGERVIYIENDVFDLNMRTVHDSLYTAPVGGSPGEVVRFIIEPGITVGSTASTIPAMQTGIWPEGVALLLDVGSVDGVARVQGKGGDAGKGGATQASFNGVVGGTAFKAEAPIVIENLYGEIWGGGGGGATSEFGRIGGGGGAGTKVGLGGPGNPSPGAAGTSEAGGAPGAAEAEVFAGAGGAPGAAGGSAYVLVGSNPGGAAGNYIEGNSFVTWVNNGSRIGGVA